MVTFSLLALLVLLTLTFLAGAGAGLFVGRDKVAEVERRLALEREQHLERAVFLEGRAGQRSVDDGESAALSQQVALYKKQRDDAHEVLGRVFKERDRWILHFHEEAAGHTNAQQWLMGGMEALYAALLCAGVKVDPMILQKAKQAMTVHERIVNEAQGDVPVDAIPETPRTAGDGHSGPSLPALCIPGRISAGRAPAAHLPAHGLFVTLSRGNGLV